MNNALSINATYQFRITQREITVGQVNYLLLRLDDYTIKVWRHPRRLHHRSDDQGKEKKKVGRVGGGEGMGGGVRTLVEGLVKLVHRSDGWEIEGNTTAAPQGMTEQVLAALPLWFPRALLWVVCHPVLRHR